MPSKIPVSQHSPQLQWYYRNQEKAQKARRDAHAAKRTGPFDRSAWMRERWRKIRGGEAPPAAPPKYKTHAEWNAAMDAVALMDPMIRSGRNAS